MNLQKVSEGMWEPERPVESIKDFHELMEDNFYPGKETEGKDGLKDYIWRGEPKTNTHLISSFDRTIREAKRKDPRVELLKKHRQAFLYAARGRMDRLALSIAELKHYVQSRTLNENHLWAFGQHYGLATPLLDWTVSPYAALFFACEKRHNDHPEIDDGEENAKCRYVYGLKFKEVNVMSKKLTSYKKDWDDYIDKKKRWEQNPIMCARPMEPSAPVEYFSPMSSEFGRLVNQRGVFTITEDGSGIRVWVEKLCRLLGDPGYPLLIEIKILAPSDEKRAEFLKWLNTMSINHHTIYPDIEGSAKFCNLGLEIGDGYADALVPDNK